MDSLTFVKLYEQRKFNNENDTKLKQKKDSFLFKNYEYSIYLSVNLNARLDDIITVLEQYWYDPWYAPNKPIPPQQLFLSN